MSDTLRVLMLEDRPTDGELALRELRKAGISFTATCVETEQDFRAHLTACPPELILADYSLPSYDGLSALAVAQEMCPDVPFIIVSGVLGEEAAVESLHRGATDYVGKQRLFRLGGAVRRALREVDERRNFKKASDALRASERKFQRLFESSRDAIMILEPPSWMFTAGNPSTVKMFGAKDEEDFVTHQPWEFSPERQPDGRASDEKSVEAIEAAMRDGSCAFEWTHRRLDGEAFAADVLLTRTELDGRVVLQATIRDITERKRAEQALRSLSQQHDLILNSAAEGILGLDRQGHHTFVNRAAARMLGYEPGELLGRDSHSAWHHTRIDGSPYPREACQINAAHRDGAARTVTDEAFWRKDGTSFPVEYTSTPIVERGQLAGAVVTFTDITNRRQAESALRTNDERMRFTLQSANVGTWAVDFTSGVQTWSAVLEAHYGMLPGTFAGTYEELLSRVHPDDRASVGEVLARAKESGADFSHQHRAVWPDGTVRWLRALGRIVRGEDGTPLRSVGITQDVTAQHTLEAEYLQSQKMEAVGRLAGGVAHDFNNLLTAILGYCELLLLDLESDDPRRGDVAEIRKAGIRAAQLTSQLLALSRKELIQPARLDLNAILADMRPMLGRLIGEDVTVALDLWTGLGWVSADPGQIEQVILNLAVNARDAMPDGGRLTLATANVELDTLQATTEFSVTPGPYVMLTVTDTGTGMTPQVQARLFEPFFTTKPVGKGTGLGLATVHGIVTRCEGGVRVTSDLGKGTSFHLVLPRMEAAQALADEPRVAPRHGQGGETVLVVEDAKGPRELLARLLQRQGYRVLVAANAADAIRVCDANDSVDLLLTDVVMPGVSGPELSRQLTERRPTLKVIYMSGYAEHAIVNHGVVTPGIAFLHKPFSTEVLATMVRDVLDR